MTKRKFAAFDIDGTVARDSIFFAVVDELIAKGHLPAESGVKISKKLEEYKSRKHSESYNEYSKLMVETLFGNIHNLSVKNYRTAVDKIMSGHKQYVYVYTRDLIKQLKSDGYFLIALSGSEMYAVQQFCNHHGFDVAMGDIYKEKDGIFTGEFEYIFGRKDIILKDLIKEHNLTLEGSIAVGDSKGDMGMFECVERPIAFNPESRLYDIAVERGWEIVVERKNVIYELKPQGGKYHLES